MIMKTRESGMPTEAMWQTFFSPTEVLRALGLRPECAHVVDVGCGYGTFTVPAAKVVRGTVDAFDVEPAMIEITKAKAQLASLTNITLHLRDFVADGTGLPDSSVDYVMLFNILHAEDPLRLIHESFRILAAGGLLGILHWNYDPRTPRGPSMDIRPKPEDCRKWARDGGFAITVEQIDLPPYHYGIVAAKNA